MITMTMNDDNDDERQQRPRATATTTSDDNNHEWWQQSRVTTAITSDASNNKRCHIIFSFSIIKHRDIYFINYLIIPMIMRDDNNYIWCQQ